MTYLELLRKVHGLTQQQLGEKIGVGASWIANLENGWTARLSPKREKQLQAVLGEVWTAEMLLQEVSERPVVRPPKAA